MSTTEITTDAAWIAGLAIVALLATGWRKTARATAPVARARRSIRALDALEELDAPLQTRTSARRKIAGKLWAAVASSTLAIVAGALIATIVSIALAMLVVRATGMLKQ